MLDHVETCLRTPLDNLYVPVVTAQLDHVLFADAGDREQRLQQYLRLLRHPELLPYLTLKDKRLSSVSASPRVPAFMQPIPAQVLVDVERLMLSAPEFLSDVHPDLYRIWFDSDEALLRLGAAVLALAYTIGAAGDFK